MKGLGVGKFAPLHLGHELVIQRALAECAELVLISYCDPEPTGCTAERRSAWLAARFPQARRIVGDPARWPEMPRDADGDAAQRAFVRKLLQGDGLGIDVVYTSEEYGAVLAQALGARHVLVDAGRHAVRISGSGSGSGSQIRADVHAQRQWLAPEVYASLDPGDRLALALEEARRHLRGLGGA